MAQWFLVTLGESVFNQVARGDAMPEDIKGVLRSTGARLGSLSDMARDVFPPKNEGIELPIPVDGKVDRALVFGVPSENADRFERDLNRIDGIEEVLRLAFCAT